MKKLFFVSLLLSTTAFAQTGPGPTPNVWYVCGSGWLCLNGVNLSGLLITNGSSPSTSIAPGSGVATALAVNVGSAGAFITNGGAILVDGLLPFVMSNPDRFTPFKHSPLPQTYHTLGVGPGPV